MDRSLEHYMELKDKDIIFKGETLEEKDANLWLYHTTLELNRYQDMTKEVLEYIEKHLDSHEVNEIYDIIRQWVC